MVFDYYYFLQDSKKSEENEIEQFIQAIFMSRKKKDYMLLAVKYELSLQLWLQARKPFTTGVPATAGD